MFLLFTLCFFFWPWGMWDLNSPTRDQTHSLCSGRWSLNHRTASKVPHVSSSDGHMAGSRKEASRLPQGWKITSALALCDPAPQPHLPYVPGAWGKESFPDTLQPPVKSKFSWEGRRGKWVFSWQTAASTVCLKWSKGPECSDSSACPTLLSAGVDGSVLSLHCLPGAGRKHRLPQTELAGE